MNPFRRLIHWFITPQVSSSVNPQNFINVQIDAIGVALANSASPFLPVFLARYGASAFQVGMLTWMPAVTGLALAVPLGLFLQSRTRIIPWFSFSRLAVIACFALTGLVSMVLPKNLWVAAVLIIWALATIPQTMLSICFSVVMSSVAGPEGRMELMSRRWSIYGMTGAITVFFIGQLLEKIVAPLNYQLVFLGLSLGGLVSFYFSSHITIPDRIINRDSSRKPNFLKILHQYLDLIRSNQSFTTFIGKRFVFLFGFSMAVPLFPLYYVRVIQAPDSWIATISTAQTFVMVFGYFFWARMSRKRSSHILLFSTTLGLALFPIFTSQTSAFWLIAVFSGISGVFQAGLDLVFFDELFRTVPMEYSATFVSLAQSFQYLSSFIAPLLGSALAGWIGIGPALLIAGLIRLTGSFLFLIFKPKSLTPSHLIDQIG